MCILYLHTKQPNAWMFAVIMRHMGMKLFNDTSREFQRYFASCGYLIYIYVVRVTILPLYSLFHKKATQRDKVMGFRKSLSIFLPRKEKRHSQEWGGRVLHSPTFLSLGLYKRKDLSPYLNKQRHVLTADSGLPQN